MADIKSFGPDVQLIWKDRKRFCGLPLSFTRYYLIRKPGVWVKLIADIGFFTSKIEEINLFRVDDISIFASFSNKFWGVGNIRVISSDKSCPELTLLRVKDPNKVRSLIMDLVESERKARNVHYGEFR